MSFGFYGIKRALFQLPGRTPISGKTSAHKPEMNWGADLIGVVLVTLGALLWLKRSKRKFDRTNEFMK